MVAKFLRIVMIAALIVPASISAQNLSPSASVSSLPATPADVPFRGFNAYASVSGLVARSGSLLKLDSSVGYDFNRNFGIYAGVPLYFTNSLDGSSSSPRVTGAGDAYIGAELYTFAKALRYSSSVTIGFPTGSTAKGLSPGVVTADWTNHFRRRFGKVTPQLSVGLANTTGVAFGALPSSELINGSLAARGTFVYLEEGAEFDLTRRTYVGGQAYHILPFGNRPSEAGLAGSATPADTIVPENGVDAWVGFLPNSIVSTEVGYSRSVTFAANSVSFRMGFNVGRMLRRSAK